MNWAKAAMTAALLTCCFVGSAGAETKHAQLLIQTQSCWKGTLQHPTNTFVAVFTPEQAAPLEKMGRERERRSKALNAVHGGDTRKLGDTASSYFDFSNRFFEKLDTLPALARIKRMKGPWVRLGVPMTSRLIVYGYISDEGEPEPELVRMELRPSVAKETVVTLDYTDPVLCKYRGSGNPYAPENKGK